MCCCSPRIKGGVERAEQPVVRGCDDEEEGREERRQGYRCEEEEIEACERACRRYLSNKPTITFIYTLLGRGEIVVALSLCS